MIFASVPVADCAGALLAHGQLVAGQRWAKGRRLSAADAQALAAAGHTQVMVARLAADDVAEDMAAAQLGTALAGPGVVALPARHGRVNLAAAMAGLVQADAAMVLALNGIDEAITLGTLPDASPVNAGDILATIKIIPYAVPVAVLAQALALLPRSAGPAVALAPFRAMNASLISTELPGADTAKVQARTMDVTRRRLAALGSHCTALPAVPHDAAALAAAITAAPGDLVLVAGASATLDRADVVPAAIVAAGGRVERLGMPVDPGNLLVLGEQAGRPVIGLPGCARSPRRNGLDMVLEALAAGLPVTSASIAAMGLGGLLPDAERPEPRLPAAAPGKVGAVVLAAGRSSRMGADHKLLALWQSKPLVAHVLDAIAAAGLPPPLVVLGARAADVRAACGDRPAQFVTAPDWEAGLAHSLAAGIAALPADWDAALVCLADMPRVEPALLAALATAPGDVVLPQWQGRRGNPVRWGRRWFPRLRALTGDAGGKALLAEAAVQELPAPSDACLADVDTPAMLAALTAKD
ncbi:MAG: NTP transferase domain-containing protein [Sphingomonadales bacterium]